MLAVLPDAALLDIFCLALAVCLVCKFLVRSNLYPVAVRDTKVHLRNFFIESKLILVFSVLATRKYVISGRKV